ncbi:GNAT family N-acetyltransferase [Aquabacter sp. CN5-332]|uniref:GNAT family N-acetyltransferase n=1 Tax=Aquabacter sp. CN5-332 TaxID=3156608 RepID=UPI0032B5D0D1
MSHLAHEVRHEETTGHGRYFIRLAPGAEAEMTYRRSSDRTMVIGHTEVPRAFEGRGIAAQLVDAAIADARKEGYKIVPLCSYVSAQFLRHPEWRDLLA